MRPVLEIMFIDFIMLALDQVVDQARQAHSTSGGQLTVPLVIRHAGLVPGQRGAGALAELQAGRTDVPGVKVVMPSRASDVAGLKASARSPTPTP